MTKIVVEVIETGAGLADVAPGLPAIRLSGVAELPADPTFRIAPIDETLAEDGAADWPTGPRRPVSVHSDGNVHYLILGADVLESPLLSAGTPVVVSVTDTAGSDELVWPELPAAQARRRRPVIVTEQLRDVERLAVEARAREAAAAVALAAATAKAAEAQAQARTTAKRREPDGKKRQGTGANGATSAGAGEAHQVDAEPITFLNLAPGETEAEARARVLSGFSPAQKIATATGAPSLLRHDGLTHGLPQTTRNTAIAPIEQDMGPPPRGRQAMAFTGGLLAAAVLVFGLMQTRVLQWGARDGSAMASHMPDIALATAKSTSSLRSILTTAGVSPRGRNAKGVDAENSLNLADSYLHGVGVPRDQGEASFWLRNALGQALSHDSMKWALTQLGSIHASPEGFEPDYAKARLLWEIAGALGDPVALCFNASLYEHGLGVPKHKELSRALYDRARNNGGCKGAEEAVARTR